jgi:hypothetical protein
MPKSISQLGEAKARGINETGATVNGTKLLDTEMMEETSPDPSPTSEFEDSKTRQLLRNI